jgi:hypothetical protein
MDNPPVRHNEGLFAANHRIIEKPPAIGTFDTTSLSGNRFDAIWQKGSLAELLLCRVRHKHTKGHIINSEFQERVPSWLEGKLVHDGAYTRDILVKPEYGSLVNTPLPFEFPDAGGCIAEIVVIWFCLETAHTHAITLLSWVALWALGYVCASVRARKVGMREWE